MTETRLKSGDPLVEDFGSVLWKLGYYWDYTRDEEGYLKKVMVKKAGQKHWVEWPMELGAQDLAFAMKLMVKL